MIKPDSGGQLAVDILSRSVCAVQVGAALADKRGIFSWGWNSSGPNGFGQCAEQHAILRANRRRLLGATIYIAGLRKRNGKVIFSKPCETCQKLIDKWELKAVWRDSEGVWNAD